MTSSISDLIFSEPLDIKCVPSYNDRIQEQNNEQLKQTHLFNYPRFKSLYWNLLIEPGSKYDVMALGLNWLSVGVKENLKKREKKTEQRIFPLGRKLESFFRTLP